MVIGMKRSGQAAIELLQSKGAHVTHDGPGGVRSDEQAFLESHGYSRRSSQSRIWASPTDCRCRPLCRATAPILNGGPAATACRSSGKWSWPAIYSERSGHWHYGSNGKTTTTALTGHILRQCGIECQVGGNIGTAVTSLVAASAENRWNVLELSSFQLETIYRFHAHSRRVPECDAGSPRPAPHISTAYADAKARLFETQAADDALY